MTYTFAVLHVSNECFEEIAAALRAADYKHCFIDDVNGLVLDMNEIALQRSSDFKHIKKGSDLKPLKPEEVEA